jgi:hypothetical protein
MKDLHKLLLLAVILIGPSFAQAQDNFAFLAWNYNIPLTNKKWLDTPSPHGGVFGYRYFVKEQKISVGLDLSWTTFDQYEPTQTFLQENGAITTDYFKYIYQYAGVVNGQYYFNIGDSELVFPYAGLGLGASYNRFTLYYNIYEDTEKTWAFIARPEAGVLVKFGKYRSLGAIAAVHYDYSTAKNENYNYSSFSSAGFRLGVVLMSRY